jgi:hypothetical protein
MDIACATFQLDQGDAGMACEPGTPTGLASCAISSGEVDVLFAIPATVKAGTVVNLHVTAIDTGGTVLLDRSGTATINGASMGDPSCGICLWANITFSS